MNFSVDDFDTEVTLNAQFLFPVFFPFIYAIHFKHYHFRQLGHSGIRPAICDAFEPATDKSMGCWSN